MKILLVNWFGYPKYGCENYFLNLCRLLRQKGHEVIIFTTEDKRNIDKSHIDYCVNKIDMDDLKAMPLLDKVLFAPKTIYSLEAKRKIERLIKDTKPDIAHIHNIKRLISPSILHSLKCFNIPIVYTLHDYHLICPNYRLFVKGKVCQECKHGRYYNAILKKCVRNSFALSLLACAEQYMHSMIGIFKDNVDMFVAPSKFLLDKMIEYGMDPEKITCIPNFVYFDDYEARAEFGNYIVYTGRLVKEKGLDILIKAMKEVIGVKLVIIGDGEYREELQCFAAKEGINNIEFKGYVSEENAKTIVRNSLFVVVPSQWSEVFGLVIIESFAMGKPVIGAGSGGIPEVIDNNVNGLLFKPGDANDLIRKIRYLLDHKDRLREMGENGRRKVLAEYNPDIHYEKVLKTYQDLVKI